MANTPRWISITPSETTLTVCKNVYKEVAQVETDFAPLPMVSCQYGEINQVFLNIIVNAAHAIEAQKNTTNSGRIRISTAVEVGWVVIRIEDNARRHPGERQVSHLRPLFHDQRSWQGHGVRGWPSSSPSSWRGTRDVSPWRAKWVKALHSFLRLPVEDAGLSSKEVEHEQEA